MGDKDKDKDKSSRPYKANLDALHKNVIFPDDEEDEATAAVESEGATAAVADSKKDQDPEAREYAQFLHKRRKAIDSLDICSTCKNREICSIFMGIVSAARNGIEQIVVNCEYYRREDSEDSERGDEKSSG